MPEAIKLYVRVIDSWSRYIGLFAMYLIFVMIGILSYASIMKVFFHPSIWTVEMAQFVMVAYFALGGAYTLKEGEHVRMDLLYSGFTMRGKARSDLFTSVVLIGFLVILQIGGVSSLIYAIGYGEKSFSAWAPLMWPVKVVLNIGIFLTLLQAVALFFRDWAELRGEPLP
ncbi:TRAP transporter small permease subunit [Mesorhizobium australicum]|uniref:TRAP transporter small permease protein n=1 Tax=Mesorhizobium australicum TaxID=536018 RepID=A0A1X7PMS9_9HYPH|nr:TRAP transporter small permease subunit [Mesorhizobium australicum]SMH52906.1 TRAP-type mannitol/chloroaromatic compound transport system, small permease component [Mesorhizobium australicum]